MSASDEKILLLKALIAYNADHDEKDRISDLTGPNGEKVLAYYRHKNPSACQVRPEERTTEAVWGSASYSYESGKSPHSFDSGETTYKDSDKAFIAYIESWLNEEIRIFLERNKTTKTGIQRNLMAILFYLICSRDSDSIIGLTKNWPEDTPPVDDLFQETMSNVIRSMLQRVACNPSNTKFKEVMKKMISEVGSNENDVDREDEKGDLVVGGLGSRSWKKTRMEIAKRYKTARISQSQFLFNQSGSNRTEKEKADTLLEVLDALVAIFSDNIVFVESWKNDTLEYVDDFLDGLSEVKKKFDAIFAANPDPDIKKLKTGPAGLTRTIPKKTTKPEGDDDVARLPTSTAPRSVVSNGKAPAQPAAGASSSLSSGKVNVEAAVRRFEEEQIARAKREVDEYRRKLNADFLNPVSGASGSSSSSSSAPTPAAPKRPAQPRAAASRDPSPVQAPKENKPLTKDQILHAMSYYDKACWYAQMIGNEKFVKIVSTFAPADSKKPQPTSVGECVPLVYTSKKGPEIFNKLASYLSETKQGEENGVAIETALRTFNAELTADKAKMKEEFSRFSPKDTDDRKMVYGHAKRIFSSRKEAVDYLLSFLYPANRNGGVDQATLESGNALIGKFLETVPVSVKRSEILRKSGDESGKGKLVAFFEKGFLDDTINHDRLIECILHMLSLESEGKMKSFVNVLSERYNQLPVSKSRNGKEDQLPFYLSYETNTDENRYVGVIMRSLKNIKSSRRVINSMFISLMKNPNRRVEFESIDDAVAEAISKYRKPTTTISKTGKKYEPTEQEIADYEDIQAILKNLANLESPDDIDIFTYIFHPKEASENNIDQSMSAIFEKDQLPTSTLLWLFFAAAGMFFNPATRTGAIEGVVEEMRPIIRLLPKAPFNGVKMSNVAKYIFQREPGKFTTQQRLLVSYMFDDHLVFMPDAKHRTVNSKAEKVITEDSKHKEIKVKKDVLRAQYTGEVIDDINRVKTTDWLRHTVRKVLGPGNLLETTAQTLKDRQINFARPHALFILFEMFNNPQDHFHKSPEAELAEATSIVEKEYATNERREEARAKVLEDAGREYIRADKDAEKEAEKKKKKIEDTARKLPEIRKAKIMSLMSKGSMVRKEEDTYGDTILPAYTEGDAEIIYGYDFKTYPETVGVYQGKNISNQFINGATFNNNEARALKKIMEEEHIYPPIEFIQLWNDTISLGKKIKEQLAAYEKSGKLDENKIHIKALLVKKAIYDAMAAIWKEKNFTVTEPGEQIGFTVGTYQPPLTMLNLLRVLQGLTVDQYLTLVKASLYTELGRANKYIRDTINLLSTRAEKAGKKKSPALFSRDEAIQMIIRSRNLVNDYVRIHRENMRLKMTKKSLTDEDNELLDQIQKGSGLNDDDLAEINEDSEKLTEEDNQFVTAGDRSDDKEEEDDEGENEDDDDEDDE